MRKYRARKSGRNGQPGRAVTKGCGSAAAYRRHRRNGEDACASCKAAWAKEQAAYRSRRGS